MNDYELRDADEAHVFLIQGLLWQSVIPPGKANVKQPLEWAMEIASRGDPLPPIGFLADLGHIAFGLDWEGREMRDSLSLAALPINQIRTYEDHVLGKVYADWTFARASDALRGYQGRDRAKGLAFLVNQFRERAGFPGVDLPPGIIKHALDKPPEDLLSEAWESLRRDGVQPLLVDLYDGLIVACRRTAEALGPEDIFELEHRTALDDFGQRLALRQVLRTVSLLENSLPKHKIRPIARHRDVPTRILDEDTYPVGGFTSLSTRGSLESLLHSQLAFMEPGKPTEPDLFDIKFVRDELLYYSRDDNQFLRRRRTFVLALAEDLVSTRFKDQQLPYQRGILLMALLVVIVRKLSDWLSTDALVFQVVFLGAEDRDLLTPERALLQTLLREEIATGSVQMLRLATNQLVTHCETASHRSLCHCLQVGTRVVVPIEPEDTQVVQLAINGPRPALGDESRPLAILDSEDALDSWAMALEQILRRWI